VRNWILNSVPDAEFRHIRPYLEPVHLSLGATVVEQGSEVAHAIFPNSGLVSLVVMMSGGRSSEVSIAGCEGMVGIGLLGGLNRSVHSAVVQVEGESHAQVFRVSCEVEAVKASAQGEGLSRRRAEQAAAQRLLAQLGV